MWGDRLNVGARHAVPLLALPLIHLSGICRFQSGIEFRPQPSKAEGYRNNPWISSTSAISLRSSSSNPVLV
jgi:hypothetical protein